MKINVLMPTYNDEKTILIAIESLINQTYNNWHLTIINDGSTDNTEKIVKGFIKNNKLKDKVTYIYEENSDQLNALKKGLSKIKDERSLIFVLHSDDILDNNDVFKNAIEYFKRHGKTDAIVADYDMINEEGKIIGTQKVKAYNNNFSSIALMGLWLGRNIYTDVAFFKYKVYKNFVYYNYLTWNTPFWLCSEKKIKMLKVENVSFKFFKYRVFEGNYINNEIGLLCVLNGELRTLLLILKQINIPFYKLQYLIFRLLNKINLSYKVIYSTKRTKNLTSIVKFVINKRISDNDIPKYPYYDAIISFFKNYQEKTIVLNNIEEKDVYYGSDSRLFNKNMLNNKLPDIYYKLFDLMKEGFNRIITDDKSYTNLVNITKFLDIYQYIIIEVK